MERFEEGVECDQTRRHRGPRRPPRARPRRAERHARSAAGPETAAEAEHDEGDRSGPTARRTPFARRAMCAAFAPVEDRCTIDGSVKSAGRTTRSSTIASVTRAQLCLREAGPGRGLSPALLERQPGRAQERRDRHLDDDDRRRDPDEDRRRGAAPRLFRFDGAHASMVARLASGPRVHARAAGKLCQIPSHPGARGHTQATCSPARFPPAAKLAMDSKRIRLFEKLLRTLFERALDPALTFPARESRPSARPGLEQCIGAMGPSGSDKERPHHDCGTGTSAVA